MASGNDARLAMATEATYGTRVAPNRFFAFTGEGMDHTINRYTSVALGTGRWTRPSVTTTEGGSGTISGEVPTTGFGYLLNGLHGETVAPVQQGATTAYLQTHTLTSAPSRSYSVQVQTPPVTSSTLLPQDLLGVVFSGITFSWEPAGVLLFELSVITRELKTDQTLVTYVAPAAWNLFSFKGGKITIAGVDEADVVGGGSLTLNMELRDDAFALGTGGLMAKPVETDKPTAEGSFTADFNNLTNLNRVRNNTSASVVLLFEGITISGTHKETLQVTIPDCVFTSPRPTVGGPGPVQQEVSFQSASSAGTAPSVVYKSTDTAL